MSANKASNTIALDATTSAPKHTSVSLQRVLSVDAALLLLRVAFGATLALTHGLNKLKAPDNFLAHVVQRGFPAPTLLGWSAILSEFAGGLLLALGLWTRSAGLFVAATLFVAALKVHADDPFAKKELALAYAVIGLAFVLSGAGRYSLDAWFERRRRAHGVAPK